MILFQREVSIGLILGKKLREMDMVESNHIMTYI